MAKIQRDKAVVIFPSAWDARTVGQLRTVAAPPAQGWDLIVPSIGVISAHQELHPLLLLSYHHTKFIPELNYSNSKPGFLWEPSRHLQSPAAWPFGPDHSPTSQYLHNLCARLQMQAPVTVCTILEGWR